MTSKTILLTGMIALAQWLSAQDNLYSGRIELQGVYCGTDAVPFWIRSNQFGSVPPAGASIGLIGSVRKDYNTNKNLRTDWGFGAEGRLNVGNPTEFILTEGYGKFRYGIFELKAGRVKEITGLCDTLLTSGSWSVSGNARGIPGIQLAVPEYYTLPFFGELFAFKGSYMHGWMGNWNYYDSVVANTPTFLHQKMLYGRFGKPRWRIKLYGGFNHQVVWGDERDILGESYVLNNLETFLYVNAGTRYSKDTIRMTRIGNHVGSIDIGFTLEFEKIRLLIYRQSFFDAGALYYMANLRDGLNGICIEHKVNNGKLLHWKKLLLEVLYSKNQAGETWSPYTSSPYENYYNNAYYKTGWSYRGISIGSPFITPSHDLRKELPVTMFNYFDNNRVLAFHLGIHGNICKWELLGKMSFSRNYGTYLTATSGKVHGGELNGVFPVTDQFAAILHGVRKLNKDYQIGVTLAFDKGHLYYNSAGLICSISKSF